MTDKPRALLSPDYLAAAQRAQDEFGLCDHCLGRLFGKVETGLSNDKRARIVRREARLEAKEPDACHVCDGLFSELDDLAKLALDAAAPFEYGNYLVGTRVDEDVLERERELWETLNLASTAEAINTELNREVGRRIGAQTGKDVNFRDPDITVIIDTRFNVTELTFGSLYYFARYRKFERGIPQTVWPCRRCRGRGCEQCHGRGKQYDTSVQELVEHAAKELTGTTDASFHGAGREDVDARCLGTGRPFVLELKDPKKRSVPVEELEAAINAHARPRAEIVGLRRAKKAEVQEVKDHRGAKTYRAEILFDAPVEQDKLFKAVEALRGCAIAQRTPSRVEHRRADKVRDRHVRDIKVEAQDGATATLLIRGDAGLYVKELVSGDEGRTQPSVAELVGVAARVGALDIVKVEYSA